MSDDIIAYNSSLPIAQQEICTSLMQQIYHDIPSATSKVRHAHPVWFLDGNPIVGYSSQKKWICLMFWSGQSFDEEKLAANGSFKAAQLFYSSVDDINREDLTRRLAKAQSIQRDYKNIVKRKGKLEKLTAF
jgi:Domain of unknown function (DU1801)